VPSDSGLLAENMVDEPRKKKRTLHIVAGVTLVEGAFGIAILVLLYTNNGPFTNDPICDSESTTTPIYTTTPNTSETPTTVTTPPTTSAVTTIASNSTSTQTDDTFGFLEFFELVNRATICYSDIQLYKVWFGMYFLTLVLWILSLFGVLAATRYIPSNYKGLLPYTFVTLIMSLIDMAFAITFVYNLIQSEYMETLKFDTAGEFETALATVFIPLFCSKIGLYWIINVVFVIKVTKCYNIFKEFYENPFGERFNSSFELRPYVQDDHLGKGRKGDDGAYENRGYIDDLPPSKHSSNSSRIRREENGHLDNSDMEYHRNWTYQAQNSKIDDLHDGLPPYQGGSRGAPKSTSPSKPAAQLRNDEPYQNTPPPKVAGILKKKTNQPSRRPPEENGERPVKRERQYIPAKSAKPYSGQQRRPTGYYPENDLQDAIVDDFDDEYEDNQEPSYTYTKRLPSEPYTIPRANIRQT